MLLTTLVSVVLPVVAVALAHEQTSAVGEAPHPCDRPCVAGETMTCTYNYDILKYFTLSKACYDCPYNVTDCYRPGCITGTGYQRLFFPTNMLMPGPLVSVCEHDTIVIDVNNRLGDTTTTIHWHGILQKDSQYQDGVPFVTQCPINPYTSFRYQFNVSQSGSYIWHSHTAFHMLDGICGFIIVRQPPNVDPNYQTYDFDLNEHAIIVEDFHNVTGDVLHGLMAEVTTPIDEFTVPSIIVNGRGQGRMFPTANGTVYTPVSSFTVKQGFRYRFRLYSNVNLPCPTMVSVDSHSLNIIATDGSPVKPTVVDSFFIYPGERYDFVINANQSIGNYWIRFKSVGPDPPCGVSMGANLKYEGAADISLTDRYQSDGSGPSPQTLKTVVDLDGSENVILKQDPDVRFYLPFSSYLDFNPLHLPWLPGRPNRAPLINGISLTFPSSPLLSQLSDVDTSALCNETSLQEAGINCMEEYCSCVYRLEVPLNSDVEVVLVNVALNNLDPLAPVAGDPNQHDFHLHGHAFYVVSQGNLTLSSDMLGQFKSLDQQGLIARKLVNPVLKDSVGVQPNGYTVFRFVADNPGFWAFHCHVGFHAEAGMGLVFVVGDPATDVPPVPPGFPRCGNYIPPIQ